MVSLTEVELRRLKHQGAIVGPSEAQQMLLEMVPDALWEIVRVTEEINPTILAPNTVTITSQVTTIRLVDDDTAVVIDVLNTETRTEQLPR